MQVSAMKACFHIAECIKGLLEKDFVTETDGTYELYDKFFGEWLILATVQSCVRSFCCNSSLIFFSFYFLFYSQLNVSIILRSFKINDSLR